MVSSATAPLAGALLTLLVLLATLPPTSVHTGGPEVPSTSATLQGLAGADPALAVAPRALGIDHKALSSAGLEGSSATGPGEVAVSTDDDRLAGNTLLELQMTVPQGPSANSVDDLWVEEPISSTITAGVGLRIQGTATTPQDFAEYAVYVSGSLTTLVVNRTASFAPGTSLVLALESSGFGTWWSFTAQGTRIQAGGNNGTLNLGIRSAVAFAAGSLPVATPTLVATSDGNASFPETSVDLALGAMVGGTFLAPGDGISTFMGAGWGAEGFDENVSFAPGALLLNGSLPPLAAGTYLWGVGGPGFGPSAQWTSSNSASLGAAGSGLNTTLPSANVPGSNGSFCSVLGEPLDRGVTLEAGICWRSDPGVAVPFLAVATPTGNFQVSPAVPVPGSGAIAHLAWSAQGGGYWQATLNGQTMAPSGSNGTVYGGSALANATVAPWGELWGGGPSSNYPSAVELSPALEVQPTIGSVLVLASYGVAGPSTAVAALEGNAENWTITPGTLRLLPGGPATSAGMALWNATGLSPVVVTVKGAPSSTGSAQPITLEVWGNLSGGGPVSPSRLFLSTNPTVGYSATALGPGAWSVSLLAPTYSTNLSRWSITATVGAPDRAPAGWVTTLLLGPGSLLATLTTPGRGSVLDVGTTTLHFWLNTTYAPSAPVSGANLTLASALGGNLSALTATGAGTYVAVFSPTLTPVAVNNSLVGSASAPGFWPLSVSLTLVVAPSPLQISVRGLNASLPEGSNVSVVVWSNDSVGTVQNATWSAELNLSGSWTGNLVTSVGPPRSDGGRNVTLALPMLSATGSGTLLWNAAHWGYLGATARTSLTLVALPLSVSFSAPQNVRVGALSATVPFV
ncbi:MAG: hypothetical protein KGI89_12465, partial [Euryarchaeota archaeon]|nr:hypothetical protein [Euryarchaeota archaeon]